MSEMGRCEGRLSGWGRCSRVAKVDRDGTFYCTQHDPVARRARREARDAALMEESRRRHRIRQAEYSASLARCKALGYGSYSGQGGVHLSSEEADALIAELASLRKAAER